MNPFTILAGWNGYAIVAVASALAAFSGGWKLRALQADHDALAAAHAETQAAVHVIAKAAQADAATQRIGEASAAKVDQVRGVYRDIIQKVPVYVSTEADRRCPVPVGFVRLHDAAARGVAPTLPDPAGQSNDAPSGVELSAVASTVAGNYGLCRETAERLTGLQNWVRTQQDLAAKP